jgi:hypothetical protein
MDDTDWTDLNGFSLSVFISQIRVIRVLFSLLPFYFYSSEQKLDFYS